MATPIRIIQPINGATLLSQTDTEIVASLAPEYLDPTNFNFIEFTVSRIDGHAKTLAQGDLRSLKSPGEARTIWRHDHDQSGEHLITALLENLAGEIFRDSVRVTLNSAPRVRLRVLDKTAVPDEGVALTLEAVVTDIEDDPIVRVLWTPGDGSVPVFFPDLTPFTHLYAAVPNQETTYVSTVTVEDARGGSTTLQFTITFAPGDIGEITEKTVFVARGHDCGCTGMDVRSVGGNNTSIYCKPPGALTHGCVAVANPAGADACPVGTTSYQCPLGPFSQGERGTNGLGWGFEVIPHLHPKTEDVKACSEGQVARGTFHGNGTLAPNPAAKPSGVGPRWIPGEVLVKGRRHVIHAPDTYPPAGGPDWGADDYTAENDYKRHLPALGRLQWTDFPTVGLPDAQTLDTHYQFVTWLRGNLGTCWCEFELAHSWTKAGGRVGPGIATKLDGLNCKLLPN